MTAEECLDLLDDPLTEQDFSIHLRMGRWELRGSYAFGSDYLIGEYDHLREVAEAIRRLQKAEELP